MATIRPVRRFLLAESSALSLVLFLQIAAPAQAAPYLPATDAQVLATVPARASDPRARELVALRQAWRAQPADVGNAVRLAQRYFDEVAAEGDPRYVGYAQAALQPWWALPDPPIAVRVLRAMLVQFDHRFDAALVDLDAAVAAEPDNAAAWSWRTAILMVQARYAEARRSCEQMAALTSELVAVACRAQVDAATGQAGPAAAALRSALQKHADASPDERLWCLTRLAETEERRGAFAAAEAAFREALALGIPDVYVQAAYADFLLDRGRPAEVLQLLKDRGRADVLLLRLTQAAKATADPKSAPSAANLAAELAARFDAARRRGDTTHRKEESRFTMAVQGEVARALVLAKENFAVQREPIDARILLEAALAARDLAAAQPALDWMAASGIQSVALQPLVDRLKGLR
jgi:tetratricopeptide (TPR) repeat protein